MREDQDLTGPGSVDDDYFRSAGDSEKTFGAHLLHEPMHALPMRSPLIFSTKNSVADAMRAMQAEHRGVVLVTEDGTKRSPLKGIFTERDVLLRVIDRGRNPTQLSLEEVMTPDPESLPRDASIAWVLNKMEVGGFRHVPSVDSAGCPDAVASVKDVVQYLVAAFPEEILNLPPDPELPRYRTRDGA